MHTRKKIVTYYYTPRAQKLPWMTTIILWGALAIDIELAPPVFFDK